MFSLSQLNDGSLRIPSRVSDAALAARALDAAAQHNGSSFEMVPSTHTQTLRKLAKNVRAPRVVCTREARKTCGLVAPPWLYLK